MDIIEYTKIETKQIILFLENAHKFINKKLELNGKDSDLLNLDANYAKNHGGFWCLIEKDQIIGTIGLRPLKECENCFLEIRRLYISPVWQNKGLGSKLIDFAIDFSRKNAFKKVRVTTSFDRVILIYLLQKIGFYQIPKYRVSSADLFYELTLRPKYNNLYKRLNLSLEKGEELFKNTLILNPVENVPNIDILKPSISYLHGIYNTDSIRNDEEKINTKIQFSGRNMVSSDVNEIYRQWADLLEGKAVSMRLLSGLHAHTVVFMALTSIKDRVVILPETAGGHMATKSILERLGLEIQELVVDYKNKKIDIVASLRMIKEFSPKVIFIDRSEGLIYEDFSWLKNINAYKIFDASQYLTNIISKDYTNPFYWGVDLLLSTLHKNLPGPQRAMICTKSDDENWKKIRSGISTYVSNMHVFSIYSAGIILKDYEALKALSKNMLHNAILLEHKLKEKGVHVVEMKPEATVTTLHTHHIWVVANNKEEAFKWYTILERLGILVNYRKLPYNLGYGLRLGLSAATNCGLSENDISDLSEIIAIALKQGYSEKLKSYCERFIAKVKRKYYGKQSLLSC